MPLLSRWHLLHSDDDPSLELERIVKRRKLKCILSYEVKWADFDSTTIEPASILKLKHQTAIDAFENSKLKPKKGTTLVVLSLTYGVVNVRYMSLHYSFAEKKKVKIKPFTDVLAQNMNMLERDVGRRAIIPINTRATEDSMTVSDFECSASDLLELSFIVESIISR